MAEKKRVLVILSVNDFLQTDALSCLRRYLLTQSRLQPHLCLVHADQPDSLSHVDRMVRHFRPHGILANVFWKPGSRAAIERATVVSMGDLLATPYPTVMPDQVRGGRLVAEHLLGQGLPHYAFLTLADRNYGALLRWRGFRDRLREAGHSCHLFDDFFRGRPLREISDDQLCAWVAQLPKPVGIHAVYLSLAVRVLWACQEQRLHVPGDVAVVGGQNVPALSTAWEPTVSAIEFDRGRVAYEAIRLLDRILHGARRPDAPLLVPPLGIVAQQSSDVLALRDASVARAQRFIRENVHRSITVKELLAPAALSRRSLERRFLALLGHSPHDEIAAQHLARAHSLLRETALPVTQVAKLSGYTSYPLFSQTFRRQTGLTATAYRRKFHAALT